MNGFIKSVTATVVVCGGLACLSGCTTTLQESYHKYADPCWPERYGFMAKNSVNSTFASQVGNGHVLDQTIWNYHFEGGTDKLTLGGQAELDRMTRRRPNPDPRIYLQTAQDVAYDPAAPEKLVQARNGLDSKRVGAIQKYLSASTAGRGLSFEITVHNPPEVGLPVGPVQQSIQGLNGSYQGVLANRAGG